MTRRVYIILLLFITNSLIGKADSKVDSLAILDQKNRELSNELTKARNEIEYTKSLVQVGNGTISNQLSSSQHTLSSLSTLFTVIGIILAIAIPLGGWYITQLANKVSKNLSEANEILKTITELKSDVTQIETEVKNTQSLIQNNLSALYQSLQDEEIAYIFKRLEIEPEDITHFFPKLTTSGFSKSYFTNLKIIHAKVFAINQERAISALALLIQHYPLESLNDKEIIEHIRSNSFSESLYVYISELSVYHKAICSFVANKDINEYLFLFINSVIGIENRNYNKELAVETILKTWNEQLNSSQKQFVIDAINSQESCNRFRSEFQQWNTILIP